MVGSRVAIKGFWRKQCTLGFIFYLEMAAYIEYVLEFIVCHRMKTAMLLEFDIKSVLTASIENPWVARNFWKQNIENNWFPLGI